MDTLRPSFMPTSLKSNEALLAVAHKFSLAKVLAQSGSTDQLNTITLTEYRDALQALPATALDPHMWKAFLRRFQPHTNAAGIIRSPVASINNGTYLLVILPSNLNGTVWTTEQMAEGEHFQLEEMQPNGFTVTGDRFPIILPAEVIAAGHVDFQDTVGQDPSQSVVSTLQAAYNRLTNLLEQPSK